MEDLGVASVCSFEAVANDDKMVGVGRTGLDGRWDATGWFERGSGPVDVWHDRRWGRRTGEWRDGWRRDSDWDRFW